MALGGALRGERRRLGFLFFLAAAATAGGLGAGVVGSLSRPGPSKAAFPPFTIVQGIDIGGLAEGEARELLRSRLSPLLDFSVALVVRGRRHITTWRALGASLDIERALREAKAKPPTGRSTVPPALLRPIPVSATFDEGKLRRFLRGLARKVNEEPKDARLIWLGRGRRRLVPSRPGFGIEVDEAARLIKRAGRWPRAATIALPVRVLRPRVTERDLKPITAVIGSFTTYFDPGNRNRAHNIRLVAKRLRGVVVMPGEVFSFNRAVGPRTRSRGFLPAPIFVKGKVVEGIGGGTCQVSTTLYNAAKRAGMRIVERHLHSLPVHYVPPGYDATVVYGALDMKFRNPYPHPVVIWTAVRGGRLTVMVLGPPMGSA